LPPESNVRDAAAAADLACQQCRDRRSSRAFDDQLRAFEQQRDRLGDFLVGNVHDVVEQLVEDRHRQLARVLDGDAVGDRAAAVLARLDADDPHTRPHGAQRNSDARGEATAADRQHEGLDIRQFGRELEPDRALSRDYGRILEGVHERRSRFGRARERFGQRLVETRAG